MSHPLRASGALLELLDRIGNIEGARPHVETIRTSLRRLTVCSDLRELRCRPPSVAGDPRRNVERAIRSWEQVTLFVKKTLNRDVPSDVAAEVKRSFGVLEEIVRPHGEAQERYRREAKKAARRARREKAASSARTATHPPAASPSA